MVKNKMPRNTGVSVQFLYPVTSLVFYFLPVLDCCWSCCCVPPIKNHRRWRCCCWRERREINVLVLSSSIRFILGSIFSFTLISLSFKFNHQIHLMAHSTAGERFAGERIGWCIGGINANYTKYCCW